MEVDSPSITGATDPVVTVSPSGTSQGILGGETTGGVLITGAAADDFVLNATKGNLWVGAFNASVDGIIKFAQPLSGNETARIDNTGNWGIKTTSPQGDFTVAGEVVVWHEDSSSVNPRFSVVGSTSGSGVHPELTMQSSESGTGTDADYHISRNSRFQTSDDTYRRTDTGEGSAQILFNGSNDICFRVDSSTGSGAITYSDAVTILNDASVGINISPTATLHCDGTFRIGGAVTFSDMSMSGNNLLIDNDVGGETKINISGSTVIRVDSNIRATIGGDIDSTNVLHVRTEDSDSSGINVDRNSGTNGDFIGLKFKIATTAGNNRFKGGILFERTGGNGVGSLHLVNDINSNDNNANLGDAVITIDSSANTGIGTPNPATSAKLEIDSTTGAFLLPRMTTTQRNALTAVNGMMIYNSTSNVIQGYENGSWVNL